MRLHPPPLSEAGADAVLLVPSGLALLMGAMVSVIVPLSGVDVGERSLGGFMGVVASGSCGTDATAKGSPVVPVVEVIEESPPVLVPPVVVLLSTATTGVVIGTHNENSEVSLKLF